MPYMCKLCDGAEQAQFLITPLSGADTMAVGQSCAPMALISMLGSYMDVDVPKLYDHLIQIAGQGDVTPERVNLPTGFIYGPDGETILSEADVDAGLCGYVHDNWWHCHRKAKHSGRHGSVEPSPGEAAQFPDLDAPALAGADGRAE